MTSARDTHVVWFPFGSIGHMNPFLSVIEELVARGTKVTTYVEERMRKVVESTGSEWRLVPYPDPTSTILNQPLDDATLAKYNVKQESVNRNERIGLMSDLVLPRILDELQQLRPRPTVLVYDPFVCFPVVAAKVLGIPPIGMVSWTGFGAIVRPDEVVSVMEARPWVEDARKAIMQKYDCDILKTGPLMETYSPVQNIITTIEDFYQPPRKGLQEARMSALRYRCVGPLINTQTKRVGETPGEGLAFKEDNASDTGCPTLLSPVPWETIDNAVAAGRKVVFVSLGTVATGTFWELEFGEFGLQTGLENKNGKDLCRHIWGTCLEALGGREDILVVMALGSGENVMDCLPADIPDNVVLRVAVPQLEVLQRCSAFVTHGGANSVHEALNYGVPLVVVPIFGDQPTNGEKISMTGAGVCFKRPLEMFTAESVRRVIGDFLEEGGERQYRQTAASFKAKFINAGGIQAAADEILQCALTSASWLGA